MNSVSFSLKEKPARAFPAPFQKKFKNRRKQKSMDAGKCEGGTEQRKQSRAPHSGARCSGRWAVTEFFVERDDTFHITSSVERGTSFVDVVIADIAILKTGSDLVK